MSSLFLLPVSSLSVASLPVLLAGELSCICAGLLMLRFAVGCQACACNTVGAPNVALSLGHRCPFGARGNIALPCERGTAGISWQQKPFGHCPGARAVVVSSLVFLFLTTRALTRHSWNRTD